MATTSSALGDDHLHLADVQRRLKAIFIGSVGNLVEWYDFYAYAAFALYFASSFFPGDDPVVQQLNAAVLFAFGFIVRPIGGWLFGHLADHYGRRNALMLSVLLMCFGWMLDTIQVRMLVREDQHALFKIGVLKTGVKMGICLIALGTVSLGAFKAAKVTP